MRRADLTTFMCRLSWNLGTSTSWNPQGLSRPLMELLYLYLLVCSRLVCSGYGRLKDSNFLSSGIEPRFVGCQFTTYRHNKHSCIRRLSIWAGEKGRVGKERSGNYFWQLSSFIRGTGRSQKELRNVKASHHAWICNSQSKNRIYRHLNDNLHI
jgi:hypothetical protein